MSVSSLANQINPAATAARSVPNKRQALLSAVLRRTVSPLLLLLAWELASRSGVLPERVLAAPSQILATMGELIWSGEIGGNVLVSLRRVVIGLAVSLSLGTGLALVAGLSRRGEVAVDSPMQMARTLPFLGLVPLFILWFGIGEFTKIALIAFATTFPMYLTLYSGIRGIDAKLVEAARLFGLSYPQLIVHVILPGALPSFLVGLRYSLGVSWLSLVAVEQINATAGLGYLINNARDFMRTDVIVVCLLVYSVLGLVTDLLVRTIEHYALAWRPSFIKD
ncbi:ABC transporter permease [Janthinobacterium agaricidamnosum]|uniref:Putative aliphatic sulfonates transport permease protein ssuC n=1 Tax=Janthinobacterium agaricidamnosum NBRC 102515 = DSM 9628 TaxID=1349767 RepID=W0V416_9BURK|nr:ABC transporter permease [Janthinobacterium agaricidamnosum]CDG82350.1 putative aliphatic sulfonates transport permease protein ssuC [Janthinobacterium agaricidamnosum NBRC 102515 = DSM 9628]